MTSIGRLRSVLPLAALLALAGCKEEAGKQGDAKQGAAPPAAPGGPSRQDIRTGVGKMLPSVQRGFAELDLQNIAKLYAADALAGMAPKKIEDLKGIDGRTIQAVKSGQYVVLWGASPNSPGNAVVAYEKDVPTQGGMVATLTGAVTRMSPQEFQAAPKASGK
jgi:hypothetical protein